MDTRRKFWLILVVVVLVLSVLACSTSSSSSKTMAGKWLDPDTSGTITTIAAEGNGFKVVSVINPNRGGNELTQTSWSNGVLTWTYCIPGGNCLTSVTVSLNSDKLDTTWTDDQGRSGTTVFERQP